MNNWVELKPSYGKFLYKEFARKHFFNNDVHEDDLKDFSKKVIRIFKNGNKVLLKCRNVDMGAENLPFYFELFELKKDKLTNYKTIVLKKNTFYLWNDSNNFSQIVKMEVPAPLIRKEKK